MPCPYAPPTFRPSPAVLPVGLPGFETPPPPGFESPSRPRPRRHLRRVHRVAETPAIGVRRDGETETVGRGAAATPASNTVAAAHARRAKEHDAFFVDDVKRRARADAKRSVRGDERVGPIVRSTLEPRAGFLATLAKAMDSVRIEWVRGVRRTCTGRAARARRDPHLGTWTRWRRRMRGGRGRRVWERRRGRARDPREGRVDVNLATGLGVRSGGTSGCGRPRGARAREASSRAKVGNLWHPRGSPRTSRSRRDRARPRSIARRWTRPRRRRRRPRARSPRRRGQDAPGARARQSRRGTHLPGLAGAGSAHGRARRDVTARAALTRAVQQLLRETS